MDAGVGMFGGCVVCARRSIDRRVRTFGGARGEHEVELGDESQGEAEAGDDGADAVDEPAEGGVVHEVEERHQAQDEACHWLWVG